MSEQQHLRLEHLDRLLAAMCALVEEREKLLAEMELRRRVDTQERFNSLMSRDYQEPKKFQEPQD